MIAVWHSLEENDLDHSNVEDTDESRKRTSTNGRIMKRAY